MYKMYGFYDERNKLIDKILAMDIDTAKEKFVKYNPDKEYLYVEIMY